ncbi:MAG: TonB-dependent receptor plug domain-containing protein [Steroidobacter sp.]
MKGSSGTAFDPSRGHPSVLQIALALSAILWGANPALARAQDDGVSTIALKKLSIEELMDIEVTSVSRTRENLGGAAAAIAVVTNEDIRRSGATSVPEALRLIPGLHVARRNSNSWAISSRGFSSVNSEKLLVLSDTRSIYTPLFSGVLWDVQDYLLEDIERIEVIRGPGAALWGSNAVNGVINITTRSARDTQGGYLEAGAGTEEETIAGARYGGAIGDAFFFRIFGKHSDRDDSYKPDAGSRDDWRMSRFGFRADWDAGAKDAVTFQGGVYRGDIGQFSPSVAIFGRPDPEGRLRTRVNGGNVLGRWLRTINDESDLQVRFYYDRTHRDDPSFVDDLDTLDLDVQHRFALARVHEILWGVNYRYTDNSNESGRIFALAPASSQDTLVSAFVQDQIPLFDAVRLTLGTKLEHNDFSGFEVQPSVRATWDIATGRTLWGSVSRAVRVPTRLERDIAIDVTDPAGNPIVRLLGNDEFDSEELLAYELGFRWQTRPEFSIDLAVFHNRYEGLVSLEPGAPFVDPVDGRTVVPIINRNLTDGEAQGFEALAAYSPLRPWRLTASYAYVDLRLDPTGQDLNRGKFVEGATPQHQFGLRSSLDLPGNLQLDAQFRRLSDVRRSPDIVTGEGVAGYSELDIRVAWRALQQLEISILGQNLLHEHHAEFGSPAARGGIERSVYGKFAWEF